MTIMTERMQRKRDMEFLVEQLDRLYEEMQVDAFYVLAFTRMFTLRWFTQLFPKFKLWFDHLMALSGSKPGFTKPILMQPSLPETEVPLFGMSTLSQEELEQNKRRFFMKLHEEGHMPMVLAELAEVAQSLEAALAEMDAEGVT